MSLLERYIDEPADFPMVMHFMNTVVSGSVVFIFLDTGSQLAPGNHDLYTAGDALWNVARHLVADEGYTFERCSRPFESGTGCLLEVETIYYLSRPGGIRVNVFKSATSPALTPITFFPSSLLVK